jgi:hypothetical protein
MYPSKTPPVNRVALTPENAESSSNAAANGVNRNYAPSDRRSYATANAESNMELDNKPVAIQPRARSAIDLPQGPNLSSGAPNMPVLVMGGVAHAQTYQGATATAGTDGLAVNNGGRGTAVSSQTLVGRQPPLRRAAPGRSWGVTANNAVNSAALVGATNGHAVVSQAELAVSYAHAERNDKEDTATWDRQWGSRRLLAL